MHAPTTLVARFAWYAVMGAAAAYLLTVFVLMALRVPHPFEIEWMEGAIVDHVQRVAQGRPLYVAPSLEFVPFLYPFGFYAVSALASFIVGDGFLGPRLVSVLSSIGILAFIAAIVFKETGRRDAAFIGAGLFAASFRIGGAWFDVGRPDMLMLFLLVAAFFTARYSTSRWTFLVTGLFLAAAFLTKQTAGIIASPVVLWMLAARPAQGAGAALVTVVFAAGGSLLLDVWQDGWYRYYVFELPTNFVLRKSRMLTFFTQDLAPVAVAGGLGLAALLSGSDWRSTWFRIALTAGLCVGSLVSRSDVGGYANVLLPAYAALSVIAAIGFDTVRRTLASGGAVSPQVASAWPAVLLLVQFGLLVYNPLEQLPSAQSEAAGRQLVARLRESPGEVWVPYHGYLATAAGKAQRAHWMAMDDILRYGRDELRASLNREVLAAVAERRFDLIVMSNYPFLDFPSLDADYERSTPVIDAARSDPRVFLPLTGSPRRPEWFYVPRSNDAGAAATSVPAPSSADAPVQPGP